MLATGYEDDRYPVKIYSSTKELAAAMTMVNGTTLYVMETGHSMPTERPDFFSKRILDFLFVNPAPPFPYFLSRSCQLLTRPTSEEQLFLLARNVPGFSRARRLASPVVTPPARSNSTNRRAADAVSRAASPYRSSSIQSWNTTGQSRTERRRPFGGEIFLRD